MSLKDKQFHFIAAGGVGMSALAKFLLEKGCTVTGSDISESKYVKMLKNMGADIKIGQKAENIKPNMTVVISSAISEENPELKEARRLGLEVLHRSDMLKLISDDFSNDKNALFFGFSGTHGKTTTSGLCSYILSKAGTHPSYAVGGFIPEIGDNSKFDSDKIFVAELDESDGTIVKYKPDVNVINNLSYDHPDFYKNGMTDIYATFKKYIDGTTEDALLIANTDSEGCREFIKLMHERHFVTFGLKDADYTAKNIEFDGFSSKFDIYYKDEFKVKMEISIPGVHNVYNALAVFAALDLKGFHPENMLEHFKTFSGMGRRFQKVTEFNGVKVYDDYAHHPDELKASIRSVKDLYPNRKLSVIFQPHLYTRTRDFAPQFAEALSLADEVILLNIYPARELPIPGVTSEIILRDIKCPNKVICDKMDLINTIKNYNFEVLLTAGAGDVCNYLPQICEVVKSK